jgi:predicted RNase H-like HicB family nuclease
MELYEMQIELEELTIGGDYRYMLTSPDLPGLVVAGDTPAEVIALAPQVASALIASMKKSGDPLPKSLRTVPKLPHTSHITVNVPS